MAPVSPRKTIPLNGGPLEYSRSELIPGNHAGGRVTRRAFFCAVVVEGNGARDLPTDVQDLVVSLGEHIPNSANRTTEGTGTPHPLFSEKSNVDPTVLEDIMNEFIVTERSYVSRLRVLQKSYADPLRNFARKKESAILPAYEAKTVFGNIDTIVPVNEAFLVDLEHYGIGGLADVALKHFRDLRAFDCYRLYYAKREEAQAIFEREMTKKAGSSFADFVDKIKYSSDSRNRVGLRELLMEPIQRIPRYTLLWRTMIKHMSESDPQRQKLIEADAIASKIATCETDEETRHAGVMYCLHSAIDGFPAKLISNGRRFLDCIDVEDHDNEDIAHASLFLFDDIMIIAKRHNPSMGGRAVTGLDTLEKAAGGIPSLMGSGAIKKGGMSFKGYVEVADITATSIGPETSLMHLYFSSSPILDNHPSERWVKPFRAMHIVQPPRHPMFDPVATDKERQRFLENLWQAQARIRERHGRSILLGRAEQEMEERHGNRELARVYWNIYERKAYLGEPRKPKVVLHIDSLGTADPIPFGIDGSAPQVVIRVQPLAGDLCRYSVTSTDPNDRGEEEIEQTAMVPAKVVRTIHEYGLFKFRTGMSSSHPSTPTASTRSRAAIFGLDALSLSRNLFNVRANTSLRSDLFSPSNHGSGSHNRSKSTASRASNTTATTSTDFRFSQRSNSTATAATSVGDDSLSRSKLPRKLLKSRAKSPGPGITSGSESEASPSRKRVLRDPSQERDSGFEDEEMDGGDILYPSAGGVDRSEYDLTMRLELARKNSVSQSTGAKRLDTRRQPLPNPPVEATIYEADEPPPSILRPLSRSGHGTHQPKGLASSSVSSESHHSRSNSRHSPERRPIGPRAPSPLPPKSPGLSMSSNINDSASIRQFLETPTRPDSPIKSRRKPLEACDNIVSTLADTSDETPRRPMTAVEPLSIKKKASIRDTSPTYGRPTRSVARSHASPNLARSAIRASEGGATQRKMPPTLAPIETKFASMEDNEKDLVNSLITLAESTRRDVDSSWRSIKRIKLELEPFHCSPSPLDESERSSHTPAVHTEALVQQEVDARMEEMRQLIRMRNGGMSSKPATPIKRKVEPSVTRLTKHEDDEPLNALASLTEQGLQKALDSHDIIQERLQVFASRWRERVIEIEKAEAELQSAKRQCELLKSLLSDATDENEIMFEAFNEELDMMFNDAHLPDDSAWQALTNDLKQSKESRNQLSRENRQLKRSLAQVTLQKDEWEKMLRSHGILR